MKLTSGRNLITEEVGETSLKSAGMTLAQNRLFAIKEGSKRLLLKYEEQ